MFKSIPIGMGEWSSSTYNMRAVCSRFIYSIESVHAEISSHSYVQLDPSTFKIGP